MKNDWSEIVPEYDMRPQQVDALNRISTAFFEDDIDVVVLEAPTGVGKSIIELAMCRLFQGYDQSSFIVTPQKVLQDQLAQLPNLKPMKGRGSYDCELIPGSTAGQAPCLKSPGIRESHPECKDGVCPYFTALAAAKEAWIVVHNYASIMAQAHIGGHFGKRGLLCLDEGHTAVDWIRGYMTLEITTADLASITTEDPPEDAKDFMPWFRAIMSQISEIPNGVPDRIVSTIMRVLQHQPIYGVDGKAPNEHKEIMGELAPEDRVEYMEWATEKFSDPGVALTPWSVSIKEDDGTLSYVCVPIRVAPMASVLTGLGAKVMVVTATVLDSDLLLKEIGLFSKKHRVITIDVAFEPKRRPIRLIPIGSMSYNSARQTLPRLVDELIRIAEYHRAEAGIIHTVSHALANDVGSGLRVAIRGRQIVQMPREGGRDGVIRKFLGGGFGPNAILIGPGLMEGIDGAGDSARWQAMCKVPWPHRKDPVVSWMLDDPNPAAARRGEKWYLWKTAQTTVQGIGRVCRGPEDYGITYLLDTGFDKIMKLDVIPDYVTAAIIR